MGYTSRKMQALLRGLSSWTSWENSWESKRRGLDCLDIIEAIPFTYLELGISKKFLFCQLLFSPWGSLV